MEDFDIALSFDTTGSMRYCIDTVKTRMKEIMKTLKRDIPSVRMAVIAHGDYDTYHTYVIKYTDFTNNVDTLCAFINSAEGTGGGKPHLDNDEAYELSLNYCRCILTWRHAAIRILVLIGDHNPHGPYHKLNRQHIDWKYEIQQLREMVIYI